MNLDILANLNLFQAFSGLPDIGLADLFVRLIRVAISFVGLLLVLIIIYAGFLWMTSGGDDEKKDNAKKMLVNAIIGLIIILSATSIANFVIQTITGASTATSTPF